MTSPTRAEFVADGPDDGDASSNCFGGAGKVGATEDFDTLLKGQK